MTDVVVQGWAQWIDDRLSLAAAVWFLWSFLVLALLTALVVSLLVRRS